MRCNCPYVICSRHGRCNACIAYSRSISSMAHCMEDIAQNLGARFPIHIPETILCDGFDELGVVTADYLSDIIEKKPDALICLAAGTTILSTLRELVKRVSENQLDLSKVRFVSLDEWLDLDSNEENCFMFLNKHFYNPAGINNNNIVAFNPNAKNLEVECKRIDDYIFSVGGIDCAILGLGMNGHLGLNEPGESFMDYSKIVELDSVTKNVGQKYFSEKKELTRGITLGIHHFFETKNLILQISGSHKAEITEKVYRSRPQESLPGTVVKLMDNAKVILDRDAARNIMDLLNEEKTII